MAGARKGRSTRAAAGEGTARTCIATRAVRPVADLLRFVAAPDHTVVPDLDGKLPGRGAWVLCSRASVVAAIRTKAFGRALEPPVTVPPDLADLIERLLVERTLGALSLANKAGLVVAGFAKVEARIAGGAVAALLHASDAADDGARKLQRRLSAVGRETGKSAAVCELLTVEQLSLALGRSNVVHACLSTGGATAKFLAEAGRLTRYRAAPETSKDEHAAAGVP